MHLEKIRIRFHVLLAIITALFLLTAIGWSALATRKDSLHTGQTIAILQLAGIFMQIVLLVALTSHLQAREAAIALDRMVDSNFLPPEYDPPWQKVPTEVPLPFERMSIVNLKFRFPGNKQLLNDISLELKKGEIIALSGQTGHGKSTLLQILQKDYPYDGGSVWIGHRRLETIDAAAWRRTVGFVPQEVPVFNGTLLANICLDPAIENRDRVRQFCQLYGFDRFFEHLPQSYTTLLGEGGVALSGGEKQLLGLARCLYTSPQLILLDEPTAAMDAATEQFVIAILHKLRAQAALLIVSHKDSLTEMADRVYLLEKGTTCQVPRSAGFSIAN